MMIRIYIPLLLFALSLHNGSFAQLPHQPEEFTRQDTLRGSVTPERAWWDVQKYILSVKPDFEQRSIRGSVGILYKVTDPARQRSMQIDLQQPMRIDSIYYRRGPDPAAKRGKPNNETLSFRRDGNLYYVDIPVTYNRTVMDSILVFFSGEPRVAVNPPWDGGWIFNQDDRGRPWMTVACQGLGASAWYPCKDHQGDEPDQGAIIQVIAPSDLVAVANGRLQSRKKLAQGTAWTWVVRNPINNYNIVPYIGKYVHWSDQFTGEKGRKLSLDYWVLDYNLAKSKKQFGRDVKPMLKSFEYWFGPYPFYEDGFKLVETPHLGMEHQSAIAYGNRYMDGYMGMDLSHSGWGRKWDYIIIHESGHEWFANSITTRDLADMWVHEGFTMYSEVLFVESLYGKKAADAYCQGLRSSIDNDRPLIGPYGVNREGSGDMYNKGANLLHTIRQVIDNDALFRQVLRGMNRDFRHQTVDSKDVENYMTKRSGKDLSKIFDQYLRTIQIPQLEYKWDDQSLSYRWTHCVNGFNMPVRISLGNKVQWIHPREQWQSLPLGGSTESSFSVDKNFYITLQKS